MDITANNIANADTSGFKAERVQFADWLNRQGSGATGKSASVAYVQDAPPGATRPRGIVAHRQYPRPRAGGRWVLTVSTPNGPRLTRNGHFGLLPDGTLADAAGHAALDTAGQPIRLAPTDVTVTIAGDGTLSSENGQLARIGVVKPSDPMRITAESGSLYRADVPTAQVDVPGVVQGAVEGSNVQPVTEITRMMDGLRQFQFVSELVQPRTTVSNRRSTSCCRKAPDDVGSIVTPPIVVPTPSSRLPSRHACPTVMPALPSCLPSRHACPPVMPASRHAGEGRYPRLSSRPQRKAWIPAFAA